MINIRFVDSIILLLLIIILITASYDCNSSERIRFYDTKDGWAKPTWNHADKQSDGSWRIYDDKGRFKGRLTKDRFYNRRGEVEEKYYLIPNK